MKTETINKAINKGFTRNCASCKFGRPHIEKHLQTSFCMKWKENVLHFEDTCNEWETTKNMGRLTQKHLQYIIDHICK